MICLRQEQDVTVVELVMQWILGSIPHGESVEVFLFQPLLYNWCNKSRRIEGNRFIKNRFRVSAMYHGVLTQSLLMCCTLIFVFHHKWILPVKTKTET